MREGVAQGGPLSPTYFSLAMLPALKHANDARTGARVTAYLDDVYIVGTESDTTAVAEAFSSRVRGVGLVVNPDKTKTIVHPDKSQTDSRTEVLGTPLFGPVPVSSLDRTKDVLKTAFPLLPAQDAFHLLRYCVLAKENYTMRTSFECKDVCKALDDLVASAIGRIMGFPGPLGEKALDRARLPMDCGGLGLRSQEEVAPAAFLGAYRDFWNGRFHPFKKTHSKVTLDPSDDLRSELEQAISAISTRFPGIILPHSPGDVQKAERRLQRLLTTRMDEVALKRVEKAAANCMPLQASLLSARSQGAFEWLQALPSCRDLAMTDSEFSYALCARLRVPCPSLRMAGNCAACYKGLSAFHAEKCKSVMTFRHDQMLSHVSRVHTQLGLRATLEPTGFFEGGFRRGDLSTINIDGDDVLLDLAFAAPTGKAAVKIACKQRLHAAETAEARKRSKYKNLAENNSFKFRPLAIEAGAGAFGSALIHHLRDMLRGKEPLTPAEYGTFTNRRLFTHYIQVLSCAAQRVQYQAAVRCCGREPRQWGSHPQAPGHRNKHRTTSYAAQASKPTRDRPALN